MLWNFIHLHNAHFLNWVVCFLFYFLYILDNDPLSHIWLANNFLQYTGYFQLTICFLQYTETHSLHLVSLVNLMSYQYPIYNALAQSYILQCIPIFSRKDQEFHDEYLVPIVIDLSFLFSLCFSIIENFYAIYFNHSFSFSKSSLILTKALPNSLHAICIFL